MSEAHAEPEIRFRHREAVEFSFSMPKDVLDSLKNVADDLDMSVEALVRWYVGSGLRADISRLYGERVMDSIGKVLAQHIESPAEVEAILEELREASAGPPASWLQSRK